MKALTLVFLLFVVITSASGEELSVTGTWEGEASSTLGRSSVVLRLEQNGLDVTGVYDTAPINGTMAVAKDLPLKGALKAGNVLELNQTGGPNPYRTFTVTIFGDTLKGTVYNKATRVQSNFEARRKR